MRYQKITHYDIANGIGIRVVLWVSGCNHHCPECHNPETWDANKGELFTDTTLNQLKEFLAKPWINGITFSGGDPLFPSNRSTILKIAQEIKDTLPTKTIWLYTGYRWEDICDLELMRYVDVLVDGEFKIELKDISLPFCGSQNQRIIDVPQTLESGKIVLWENHN